MGKIWKWVINFIPFLCSLSASAGYMCFRSLHNSLRQVNILNKHSVFTNSNYWIYCIWYVLNKGLLLPMFIPDLVVRHIFSMLSVVVIKVLFCHKLLDICTTIGLFYSFFPIFLKHYWLTLWRKHCKTLNLQGNHWKS